MNDFSIASRPMVSVVVITYRTDPAILKRCLDSIVDAAKVYEGTVETIIHDNSGSDDLCLLFAETADKWISSENVGFSRAANRGVEEAKGQYVLLLNPDAWMSPTSIAEFVDVTESVHKNAILCGWLTTPEGNLQVDALTYWIFSSARKLQRARKSARLNSLARSRWVEVEKVSGGACFGKRELLRSLGPYDERFFLYGEDADFSRRAQRASIDLLAVPLAQVTHIGAASQTEFSGLVEAARADAAIRLSAYQTRYLVSVLFRIEFLFVTIVGLILPTSKNTSGSRRARMSRIRVIGRWGLKRDSAVWRPVNA